MQHVRVGVYELKTGTYDQVLAKVEKELLPQHRQKPGFIAYDVVRTGPDKAISISTWDTAAQAEDAATRSVDFVKTNLANALEHVENHVGELALTSRR